MSNTTQALWQSPQAGISGVGWGGNRGSEDITASNAGNIIQAKMVAVGSQAQVFVFRGNTVGILVPQSISYVAPVNVVPRAFSYVLILCGLYFLIPSISNLLVGNWAVGIAGLGPLSASLLLGLYLINKKEQLK